jgi:seryl-tRNA synthetase
MDKDLYPIKDAVSQLSHTTNDKLLRMERANTELLSALRELQRKSDAIIAKIDDIEKTLIRQQTQRTAEGNLSNSLYDIKNQLGNVERTLQSIQQQTQQQRTR